LSESGQLDVAFGETLDCFAKRGTIYDFNIFNKHEIRLVSNQRSQEQLLNRGVIQ